jgi:hypothetical protein
MTFQQSASLGRIGLTLRFRARHSLALAKRFSEEIVLVVVRSAFEVIRPKRLRR